MSDAQCPVCRDHRITTPVEQAVKMCSKCADVLGVRPMPKPRRPPVPCRHCNGMSFVRAIPREVSPGPETQQIASPMAATIGGQHMGWPTGVAADARRAFGILEMYVCRGCGFVEWYCCDPENIPIGPSFMTEAIELGGEGPYR